MKNKVKYISVIIILLVVLILFLLLFNDLSKEKEINIEEYTKVYMYNLGNSNVEIIKKNDSIILVNSDLKEDLDDLIDELNKLEIYEIDYLIVTNKDDKYVGNVTYLLDNYLVDYIYMNDYEYSSKILDEVNSSLVGSYTENIILTSNEIITLEDLTINIYPYMENDFSMNDKTLVIEMLEGNNSIYLTSNSSDKRFEFIDKSTLLVSENKYLFEVDSKYYLLDNVKNKKSLSRDLNVFMNKKELIIK